MSAKSFPEFLGNREPGRHFLLGELEPLPSAEIAKRAAEPIPAWVQPMHTHYNDIRSEYDTPLPGFELENAYQPKLELDW